MLLYENRSFHDSSMPFSVEVSEDLKVSGVPFRMALLAPFSVWCPSFSCLLSTSNFILGSLDYLIIHFSWAYWS